MPASLVILASRPPKWTQEQFTTWWRGEHATFAKKLPRLQAYRHGVVVCDYGLPEDIPLSGWRKIWQHNGLRMGFGSTPSHRVRSKRG